VKQFKAPKSGAGIDYAFATLKKVEGSLTQWSIVFDTENYVVYFNTKTHPEIRSINLQNIDFACNTSIGMIDIHEKLSGDITKQFKPYSSKLHFDHALHAWKRWGVNIDTDTLKKQIIYIENFQCQEGE